MPKQIILYSAPGCQGCAQAKQFFSEQGISYTERDISTDETAKTELQRRGIRGTPVIVVGDKVMVGFNPDKLKLLLRQAA